MPDGARGREGAPSDRPELYLEEQGLDEIARRTVATVGSAGGGALPTRGDDSVHALEPFTPWRTLTAP